MKNRKSIYTLIALLFAVIFFVYDNYNFEKQILSKDEILVLDKNISFLPTSTTGQIIQHKYYSLSYSEYHEQAEWVAYYLKADHIKRTKFKRPYFNKDTKVKTKSAHYKNFKNSGFDKGHLCPAGDRKFSKEAYDATFLMSNVSPQKHDFNSGVWNRLEQKTRYWATKYKGIYVVTGGILTSNLPTIGRDEVAVPEQFYKIILDYTKPEVKAIAFLLPHKDSNKALFTFVTSIDTIETLTNIDFFPELPDEIENKLEETSSYKQWSFR